MADFWSQHLSVWWPWPLTFWSWNWCAMSLMAWATFWPILVLVRFFFVELWANTSNWCGIITLTFDLCSWCRSLCSICIPSLKFVGLPVLKIRLIFGHCRCVSPCSRYMHHCSQYLKCADGRTDWCTASWCICYMQQCSSRRRCCKGCAAKNSQECGIRNNGRSRAITCFCMHR